VAITYDEIRVWARWLNCFTAAELADALGNVPIELGEQGVKALVYHGTICDTGIDLDGRAGSERLYEYIPLPPGPRNRYKQRPIELQVFLEMGGDPLRVPRGMPVAMQEQRRGNLSRTGMKRPGRRSPQGGKK